MLGMGGGVGADLEGRAALSFSRCLGATGGCAGGCSSGCGLAELRVGAACPVTRARWRCGRCLCAHGEEGTCPCMCEHGRGKHTHPPPLPLLLPPRCPLRRPCCTGSPCSHGTGSRWPRQTAWDCPAPRGSGLPRPPPPPRHPLSRPPHESVTGSCSGGFRKEKKSVKKVCKHLKVTSRNSTNREVTADREGRQNTVNTTLTKTLKITSD